MAIREERNKKEQSHNKANDSKKSFDPGAHGVFILCNAVRTERNPKRPEKMREKQESNREQPGVMMRVSRHREPDTTFYDLWYAKKERYECQRKIMKTFQLKR